MPKNNKIIIEALLTPYNLSDKKKKEYASRLELPENDQNDLLYLSAILVSTGTNKNGATFLGSELIKARKSIALKPLDVEHEEDKIIGHICSSIYMDQEGNTLDDEHLYAKVTASDKEEAKEVVEDLDNMEMDIGIVAVVYKDRFKTLAEEIELGKWKVSMECYYKNYDLKVGDLIIPKDSVKAHQDYITNLKLNEAVRLTIAGKDQGNHKVSRVLRDISFCGVGIVENPANPRSVVLEAAKQYTERVIEREGLDAAIKEAATLAVDTAEGIRKSPLSEDNLDGEVVQFQSSGYILMKNNSEIVKDSFNLNYEAVQEEAIRRTSLGNNQDTYTVLKSNSSFVPRSSVELNEASEAVVYKTNDIGNVSEIVTITNSKESAHLANRWRPEDSSAGICIDFRKYLYEYPGRSNPGKIVATHWCKLFEAPCPVLGADAQDPSCLRHKYSRRIADKQVHDRHTLIAPYAPETPAEETILLEADEQPTPPTLDEQILSNPSEDSPPSQRTAENTGFKADLTVDTVKVVDSETIKQDPISPKEGVSEYNPILDFPVQVAKITKEERASIPSKSFGLPDSRQWPLHKPELVKHVMSIFPSIEASMPSFTKRRELFKNVVIAALKHGIDTKEFELNSQFKVKAGKDLDEDYGVPRLKLFPLSSREQVIAAMSRYSLLKADISDEERDRLGVNILRAAKKFNIDSESFRNKVFKVNQ